MRKRKKKTATRIPKKTIYSYNNLSFKTKDLMDYYIELSQLKKDKIIKSFNVPTIQDKITKNKLHAIKCEIDGNIFDSLMESRFYILLLKLKKEKKIKEFKMQQRFTLMNSFKKNNKTYRKIEYIADYVVKYMDNSIVVYDVKGKKTDVFTIKEKLFNNIYPDVILRCIQYKKRDNKWIYLDTGKEFLIS